MTRWMRSYHLRVRGLSLLLAWLYLLLLSAAHTRRSSKEQRRLVDPHESAVQLEWTDSEAIVEYSEEEPLPAKPELKVRYPSPQNSRACNLTDCIFRAHSHMFTVERENFHKGVLYRLPRAYFMRNLHGQCIEKLYEQS